VVKGVTGIVVLHTLRRGEPKLFPSLESESSLKGDPLRMACSDGNPLRVMPPNPVLKLPPPPLGDRPRLSKQLVDILRDLYADQKTRVAGDDGGLK
jgi:hypothetical protein